MDRKVLLSDIVELCNVDERIVVYQQDPDIGTHKLVDTFAQFIDEDIDIDLEVIQLWGKEDENGSCLSILV